MHCKFYLGLGLLVAALLGCLWIGQAVERSFDSVNQHIQAATTENLSDGVAALKQGKKVWDKLKNGLASISNHAPMDEIDGLFAKAITYGEKGLGEDFLALCQQLKLSLQSLVSDHRLTWWNLLVIPAIE